MMPPLTTVGSSPAASKRAARTAVVVVLPCVPATATARLKRISSPSMSARRTTGRRRARAATSSGLPGCTAVLKTTTAASPRLAASWPTATGTPRSRKRWTFALSATSEPCTR